MSDFHRTKWNIESEGESQVRIITSKDGAEHGVKEYAPGKLATQSKPLPADKPVRQGFKLNQLQGQLRTEQENAKTLYDSEIESVKKAAYEEGLKQGFAQGHQEGLEAGKQEGHQKYLIDMRGNINKIQELTTAYEAAKSEIYSANERVLVQIAFQVAKKVILKELSTDEQHIQRTVKDIVDRLGVKESIRIKVSPKDLYRLEIIKKELTDHFVTLKNITVEASDRVQSGCVVETEFNVIDAQIESQLNEIFGALIDKASEKEPGEPPSDVDPT